MNNLFAKCVLYAYPNIHVLCDQIDDLVMKDALNSMTDISPAISQCEKIVDLTYQKDLLFDLYDKTEKVLTKFSDDDCDLLDYKYFKKKPKSYFFDIDVKSRAYFRRQIKLVKDFSVRLEKAGITDKVFMEKYLTIDFFRELYRRVCEYEIMSYKNKKKSNKTVKTVFYTDTYSKTA